MSTRRGRVGQAEDPRYHASDVTSSFLDVRRHGFARVAVCVPEVRVADPAFNVDAHLTALGRVHAAGAHYAVCPELGLSAYTCGDLFFQEPLLRGVLAALERLARETAAWNLLVSVGAPLVVDGMLFNCAVTLYGGRPVAVAPKAYPPELSRVLRAALVPAGGGGAQRHDRAPRPRASRSAPTCSSTLPHLPTASSLHTEICEDLWMPVPPSALAALAGATVLANLSASNVTVGKWEYRQRARPHARRRRTWRCSSTAPPASASRRPTWPGTATA